MPFCPNCGREVQGDAFFCPSCGRNLKQSASPLPASSGLDSDASTAKTLTLVAILLQLVFFVVGIFVASFVLLVAAGVFGLSIFAFIFVIGFLVSVIWIALDYFLIYKNLESPVTVPRARTPAIVLGIVQLIVGGLIPGILLIIAYVKIGDSMRKTGQQY